MTFTRRRDTVPMEEMVFGDAGLLRREGKIARNGNWACFIVTP